MQKTRLPSRCPGLLIFIVSRASMQTRTCPIGIMVPAIDFDTRSPNSCQFHVSHNPTPGKPPPSNSLNYTNHPHVTSLARSDSRTHTHRTYVQTRSTNTQCNESKSCIQPPIAHSTWLSIQLPKPTSPYLHPSGQWPENPANPQLPQHGKPPHWFQETGMAHFPHY